jgi:putative Holliday junction resolvase
LASPLTIISRTDEKADLKGITDIIDQHQVGKVIAGLPRSMDGSIGKQAEKVQAFVRELCALTRVSVEFRDERLSTVSARRMMREAGRVGRARDDAAAAALILQGYLDEAR